MGGRSSRRLISITSPACRQTNARRRSSASGRSFPSGAICARSPSRFRVRTCRATRKRTRSFSSCLPPRDRCRLRGSTSSRSERLADDRSLRAKEYRAHGKEVPSFDLAKSSPELRALLLACAQTGSQSGTRASGGIRSSIRGQRKRPQFNSRSRITSHRPTTSGGSVRRPRGAIKLQTTPWYTQADRVEWIVEQPAVLRCNLVATRSDENGFAHGAPPRPRWRDVTLERASRTPCRSTHYRSSSIREPAAVQCAFAPARRLVTVVRETPVMEIRRVARKRHSGGIARAIRPAVSFWQRRFARWLDHRSGDGLGRRLREFPHLCIAPTRRAHAVVRSEAAAPTPAARCGRCLASRPEQPSIARDIEGGVFIHLDSHVAAMMEDRPPLGVIDARDVVAHQLEGAPELLELGELLERRGRSTLRCPANAGEGSIAQTC